MSDISCQINTATKTDILTHFSSCDPDFIHDLSLKVNLEEYADKIGSKATLYEAWEGQSLIGLIAVYRNDEFDFITNVSVSSLYKGQGIASRLLKEYLKTMHTEVRLEVAKSNRAAHELYKKFGFQLYDENEASNFLKLTAFLA